MYALPGIGLGLCRPAWQTTFSVFSERVRHSWVIYEDIIISIGIEPLVAQILNVRCSWLQLWYVVALSVLAISSFNRLRSCPNQYRRPPASFSTLVIPIISSHCAGVATTISPDRDIWPSISSRPRNSNSPHIHFFTFGSQGPFTRASQESLISSEAVARSSCVHVKSF